MAAPWLPPAPAGDDRPSLTLRARTRRDERPRLEMRAGFNRAELVPPEHESGLLDGLDGTVRTPDDPVSLRIHDRTHLELALDYPRSAEEGPWRWEAYFFVPQSFRLDERSYDKRAFYDDVLSYVRQSVPPVALRDLADLADVAGDGAQAAKRAGLAAALRACAGTDEDSMASQRAIRTLRRHACVFAASAIGSGRNVQTMAEDPSVDATTAQHATLVFTAHLGRATSALRAILDDARKLSLPPSVSVAARWVDEYVSLCVEPICGSLALALQHREPQDSDSAIGPWRALAEHVAARGALEARHRQERGYDSVATSEADGRCVEHLEFRRHMLKRFVASVLWLSAEVKHGARMVVHVLSGIAAGIVMGFVVFANAKMINTAANDLLRYGTLAVGIYIVKDRTKALLQGAFADWVSRRFPDRRWRIRNGTSGRTLAHVVERAGFTTPARVPEAVLNARSRTREHRLEASAQPERVLWHAKTIRRASTTRSDRREAGNDHDDDSDGAAITEILRLDLSRWLAATDDPNGRVVFADPRDGHIYSASARRVYNLNVIYRWGPDRAPRAWRRLRVVVSRKGIERLEPIL